MDPYRQPIVSETRRAQTGVVRLGRGRVGQGNYMNLEHIAYVKLVVGTCVTLEYYTSSYDTSTCPKCVKIARSVFAHICKIG